MATILLVCTGNICRSPMAEGFLRREIQERGIQGVQVESSGVSGWEGSPATPEAIDAVAEYGLDISGHLARRLTRAMTEQADLVVAMSSEHREAVGRLVPSAASRTFTIKELVDVLGYVRADERLEQEPVEQMRASVRAAGDLRRDGAIDELMDEDIADPLGLGIESYRAVAWELEELSKRLADALFPGSEAASVTEDGADLWGSEHQEGGAR
jgi:protein-tyrosine phosphatase